MNNNLTFFLASTPTFPKARCADPGIDPELFFPNSNEILQQDLQLIREICQACVHKEDCLKFALDNFEHDGIWGGTTPAERQSIWRKRHKGRTKQSERRLRTIELGKQAHELRQQGWSWESIASRLGTSVEYTERLAYRYRRSSEVA